MSTHTMTKNLTASLTAAGPTTALAAGPATTPAAGPATRRWPIAGLALGAVLALLIVFYGRTALSMAAIWWRSDTFAHGMLVIPIALYMIWTRRDSLARLTPAADPWGLAALLPACLVWLTAYAADVAAVQQLALVAMIPALVWTLLGGPVTRAIAFPLGYLFFAVPVGEFLIPHLQDFTTLFTVKALQLTGVPVFWEGRYLSVPNGEFEVAEACSGLRYLIASLALGCLYAYLTYRSLWRRLAFIAVALVVPIIANGLRAYGIVMIAYLSDMQYAAGVDHLIYGWLFFGIVVLLMFWAGSFWREDHLEKPSLPSPAPPAGVARRHSLAAVALASVAIAASGPLGVAWLDRGPAAGSAPLLQAPVLPPPWLGPSAADADWQPVFIGADSVVHQVYRLDNRPVHLYIAFYRYQRQGAELINASNTLYDRERWLYAGGQPRTVSVAGERLPVQAIQLRYAARHRLIWHWYWVAGWTITSPMTAKLLEAWDSLSRLERGSALIAVAADYDLEPEPAEALLGQFLNAATPALTRMLEQRR